MSLEVIENSLTNKKESFTSGTKDISLRDTNAGKTSEQAVIGTIARLLNSDQPQNHAIDSIVKEVAKLDPENKLTDVIGERQGEIPIALREQVLLRMGDTTDPNLVYALVSQVLAENQSQQGENAAPVA